MLLDFLSGTKVVEELESPVNGKLTVVKDLTWGTYIKAGGLTQSGGILTSVWEETILKYVKKDIGSCLILGLGGGSLANLILKHYPNTKVTGVDIDPVMVNLGIKYLKLNKDEVQIKISDAYIFKSKNKYDLICIDLYIGDTYPKKFEDEEFLTRVKKLLQPNGIAIFNRLYGADKRISSMKFGRKLESVFSKVEVFYPQANVEFVCYNI